MPEGRKVVWFFGAGASRGAGATTRVRGGGTVPIPTQADFWPVLLGFANRADRRLIESFLFRYFRGYLRTPPRMNPVARRKSLWQVNVEEVFTFLSERMTTATLSAQQKAYFGDQVWRALIRTVGSTFRRFSPNRDTRHYYRMFCRNLLRSRDSIISFNYDTVLEFSLSRRWHYPPFERHGIRLFKPHGSINWEMGGQNAIHRSDSVATPVIVAPTHLKFIGLQTVTSTSNIGMLNQSDTIAVIWKRMEEQMRSTKAFVFVGYSFPDADLYFSSVLRSVLTTSRTATRIILVNPDALRLTEKIRARFSVESHNIR